MFPHGDADALATVITTVMADRDHAKQVAEAGQHRVLENFSAQRMAREYEALFARIVTSDLQGEPHAA
jgi:glycosyltransferase involved in cell wall biosynthesis